MLLYSAINRQKNIRENFHYFSNNISIIIIFKLEETRLNEWNFHFGIALSLDKLNVLVTETIKKDIHPLQRLMN